MKPLPRFSKMTSTRFSTAVGRHKLRFPDERGVNFLCGFGAVRLGYPRRSHSCFFAAQASQHFVGACKVSGSVVERYAARLSPQAEVLTAPGPRLQRNPLYLGSDHPGVGGAGSHALGTLPILLVVYFAVFYSVVMRREAKALHCGPRRIF